LLGEDWNLSEEKYQSKMPANFKNQKKLQKTNA